MANLVQSTMLEKLRRRLDEITITGEVADSDTDVQNLATSNFSDGDLRNRLDDAARNVAANVKAKYLPDLIEVVAPARFHDHGSIRLLGSRVIVNSQTNGEKIATRRSFTGNRKSSARTGTDLGGQEPDTIFPVYVYEDAILKVVPDPVDVADPTTASVALLRFPGSFFGENMDQQNPAVVELDDRFSNAVIYRVLFYCYITLGQQELAAQAQKAYIKELEPYLISRLSKGQQ